MNRNALFGGMVLTAWSLSISFGLQGQGVPVRSPAEKAPPIPGFDVNTGIWFPPNVSAEDYRHDADSYIKYASDLQKVYSDDPEQLERVCEVALAPQYAVNPEHLDIPASLLRTTLVRKCEAVLAQLVTIAENAKRSERHQRQLTEWFEEEWAAARKLTWAERRSVAQGLRPRAFDMPRGDEKVRTALRLIALRPMDDFAPFLFLRHASGAFLDNPEPTDPEAQRGVKGFRPRQHIGLRQSEAQAFLSKLYSTHSKEGELEASAWRGGQGAFLFLTGENFEEARRLTRDSLEDATEDNPQYGAIFLAVLDKVLGRPQTLDGLLAECAYTSSDSAPAAVSENYCRAIARSVASRGIQLLTRKSPPALVEIMLESLRSEPTNWSLRMDSIRMIALVDPSKAEEQFAAVLDLPATVIPEGARLDALQGLQNVAFETRDYRRAINMNDRWLASAGFKPSPLPPDAWRKLAAMSRPTEKEVGAAEPDFVFIALAAKFHLAVFANDLPLARKTAEQFLAYRLRTGYPQTVRDWLRDVADAEITAGDRAGATRVLGYLSTQPQDPLLTSMLQNLHRKLSPPQGPLIEVKPAERPWDETRPLSTKVQR